MKFKYDWDQETGILYKYYYGTVNLDLIKKSWEIGLNHHLFPNEVNGFIIDYREASFDIPTHRLNEIPLFYNSYPGLFLGKKLAIVTFNIKDIIVPMICQSLDEGYYSKPFTTMEAAKIWILTGFF